MAAYNKFNSFVADIANKIHNLGSDALWVGLTNTAPTAAGTSFAGSITDIAAGNGYSAGGAVAGLTSSTQTAGLYTLKLTNVVFTASGAVGPFRYAVLYNHTSAGTQLIGWWDYGSAVTMANGDTFTVAFDATNGVLTIQ